MVVYTNSSLDRRRRTNAYKDKAETYLGLRQGLQDVERRKDAMRSLKSFFPLLWKIGIWHCFHLHAISTDDNRNLRLNATIVALYPYSLVLTPHSRIPMSAPPKLTKKQKKGVAFRERKQGRGKGKDAVDDVDNDVPIQEDQDTADVQAVQVEGKGMVRSKGESKVKKQSKDVDAVVSEKQKKRKREAEPDEGEGSTKKEAKDDTQADKPKRKKKKGPIDGDGAETGVAKAAAAKKPSQNEMKQRFILFVGEYLLRVIS